LNAKASTSTQIILWLGVITVAGIGLYWFVFHFYNAQYLFEVMDNDLLFLSGRINQHCDDNHHYFKYNPSVEDGNLSFSKSEVCIKTKSIEKCSLLSCGPDKNVQINLAEITYVEATRDANLKIKGT
jgi:hypothetical protein